MSKPLPKKLKGDFENNSSELSNPQEEPLTIGRGRGRGESSTDSSSTSGSRRKIKETESEKSSIPSELRKDGREQWLASNKPIYTTRPYRVFIQLNSDYSLLNYILLFCLFIFLSSIILT
ncbi:hypothetical protein ACKWTF_002123 [Chironomus riparius]